MATVAELTSYTGNKDLGLGSNVNIPVTNAEPLEYVNTVLRDVAARDAQKNILRYQQQIKDRDDMYGALASGEVKVGDILEQDMPMVQKTLDEQTKAFQEWMKKGYGNPDGAIAYRRATQKANEAATQAQARKLFYDKESGVISKEGVPRFADERKKNLQKNLENFWGDITPYQETNRLITEPIEKFATSATEEFKDPKRPLEKGKRTYFSYDDTLKNAMTYGLTPDGLYNLKVFHDTLSEMPPIELVDKIKTINKELDRYNTERNLKEGDKDYAAPVQAVQMPNGKLSINEPLDKLAAKFSLAGKQKFNAEEFGADEGALKIAKQKLDEKEAANLNKYRMGQLANDRARLEFDKSKAKTLGVPADVANSAKEYAVQLFNKLTKLADANGNISPENMKKLTQEELKYLGTADTNENKFTLTPLSSGSISSMKITPEGLSITTTEGEGKDVTTNTLSIDVKQVAGNKLGDEMTLTTGKEGVNYNSLVSLYGSGAKSSNESVNSKITEVPGDVQVSGLSDGQYKINSGKNKGKVVTIKDGQAVSIK